MNSSTRTGRQQGCFSTWITLSPNVDATTDVRHEHKSNSPCSISKLLHRSRLPSVQERRQQLRLVLFYKMVVELVSALPPERLTPQQPARLVRNRKQGDFSVNTCVRNNDRCFNISPCHTAHLWVTLPKMGQLGLIVLLLLLLFFWRE